MSELVEYVEANAPMIRPDQLPVVREILDCMYQYTGRVAAVKLYEIAAGFPTRSKAAWGKLEGVLCPDFLIRLEEYDETKRRCRQWAVALEVVKEIIRSREKPVSPQNPSPFVGGM